MSKKPETLFKERVQSDLDKVPNCWHEKIQQKSIRGTPDILACVNGFFVALELKVDSKIDKLQHYKLEKIRRANGSAFVVEPETWPTIFSYLLKISKGDM